MSIEFVMGAAGFVVATISLILVISTMVMLRRDNDKMKKQMISDYGDIASIKSELSDVKQAMSEVQGKIKRIQKGGK